MKRTIKLLAAVALGLAGILAPAAIESIRAQNSGQNLQIYWIDVEGGAATLIVSPSGESLLVDTGYPDADRDAKRIFAAAQKAGLKQIDNLVISHWHRDHEGGLAALVKMIPIGRFFDHGDGVEAVDKVR
ncbi:MAG TPA: MBL fold metallo-hydrolase, partial [Xanthobacteraceae bacterium]|nr:MBL fold metallo-hydrolase [Xanthobacteraceae bacterium]